MLYIAGQIFNMQVFAGFTVFQQNIVTALYLFPFCITFKVMQMNNALVVFVWQDGGWQKSSEGYLAMYDERTDTPVPLMKTFPQTGRIL